VLTADRFAGTAFVDYNQERLLGWGKNNGMGGQ